MKHKHTMQRTGKDRCFSGCVAHGTKKGCNPCSHGGVSWTRYCTCGARQSVNANGSHWEESDWYEPAREP